MRATKQAILSYLKELKPTLAQKGIVELGLFGSYARDENTVYSDIDVAIRRDADYLKDRHSYEYFNLIDEIKNDLLKKFHRQSDIFDLSSETPMRVNVLKELIYV